MEKSETRETYLKYIADVTCQVQTSQGIFRKERHVQVAPVRLGWRTGINLIESRSFYAANLGVIAGLQVVKLSDKSALSRKSA